MSSRAVVAARLDPEYGEDIAPDRKARRAVQYGPRGAELLKRRLKRYLQHDFGYAGDLVAGRSWVSVAAPAQEDAQAA